MKKTTITIGLILIAAVSSMAQIAQNGNYKLEQAVIGSGGGSSSDAGNLYKIEGTIGEPIAGTTSSNMGFSVKGGFFAASPLAPTAAPVSISGRVLTNDGSGLRNARVTLTDMSGISRTILSGKLGHFQFRDVPSGETYIISVASRRYIFQAQVVMATGEITELSFNGLLQSGEPVLDKSP